jgi:hypothetical protein
VGELSWWKIAWAETIPQPLKRRERCGLLSIRRHHAAWRKYGKLSKSAGLPKGKNIRPKVLIMFPVPRACWELTCALRGGHPQIMIIVPGEPTSTIEEPKTCLSVSSLVEMDCLRFLCSPTSHSARFPSPIAGLLTPIRSFRPSRCSLFTFDPSTDLDCRSTIFTSFIFRRRRKTSSPSTSLTILLPRASLGRSYCLSLLVAVPPWRTPHALLLPIRVQRTAHSRMPKSHVD